MFDSSEFDKEIAATEGRGAAARTELDRIQALFVQETVAFCEPFIRREIEEMVTSQPEVSKGLGTAGLGKVKQQLETIIQELPTRVAEGVGDPSVWPHHRSDLTKVNEYDPFGHSSFPTHEEAVRHVLACTVDLQRRFGFRPIGHRYDHNKQRYAAHLSYSAAMTALIEEYKKQFAAFRKPVQEADNLRAQRAAAEAKDLWDKA